ncbi:MAG: ATP-binding protein [Desulfobulbaceae bacterium]|nr:ATP-binding protein [Desulfobulbaceae bacterium]
MRISKLLYVSPWLLLAATGLLVLIVVTFAMNNIKREKEWMLESLSQKTATLMRIVQSGARSSYLSDLKHGKWDIDSWDKYVQRVIAHVADDREVRFLAVVNDQGLVIAHNDEGKIGSYVLPNKLTESFKRGAVKRNGGMYGVEKDADNGRLFEAIRIFKPFRGMMRQMMSGSWQSTYMDHHGIHHLQNDFQQQNNELLKPPPPDPRGIYYIIAGLDMQEYDRALGRLRLQIIGLSFTMLLVGLGGWFSLAAVQGYRISQQTIREMQAFTGHLVTHLPVGIIATDNQGRITTWNETAEELTGLSARDAGGKRPVNILPRALKDFFPVATKKSGVGDVLLTRKKEFKLKVTEQERVLFGQSVPIRDDHTEYMGRVLLLSNLTELKSMEKVARENERLAAVGRMAAGVAHEVRNPLSSIKGLALLLRGKLSSHSEGNETVMLLIREVERMNKTISELLSFARPAPLRLQPVDLTSLLNDSMKLISPDVINNGVEAELIAEVDLPMVDADRDRLQQVFMNILFNAVQAMEDGGNLNVSISKGESDTVIVTVKDTGYGISEENIAQIFYPYFTTKQGGTGIGLAISQKIISEHQGVINISSLLGEGTTVTVELPAGPIEKMVG